MLPTEAEWEYAARAGTETRYSFGDEDHELDDHGWYSGNAEGQDHRVGTKKANPKGLHDMHGNMWEQTMDFYGKVLPGGDDPLQQTEGGGERLVIRGGGRDHDAQDLRSASRYDNVYDGFSNVGFRAVRTEGPRRP